MQGSIDFTGLLSGDIIDEGGTTVIANPSGSATDTLNKVQIDKTIYSVEGDGGAEVIANPTGSATDTLNKLQIDETIYSIESGTEVVANPTGTASTNLNKIKIGDTIYNIQLNLGYSETVLWENSNGLEFKPNDSKTIQLIDSLENYDLLSFVYGGATSEGAKAIYTIPVSDFIQYSSEGINAICTRSNLSYTPVTKCVDNTHITFSGWTSDISCYAYRVKGIKCCGEITINSQ